MLLRKHWKEAKWESLHRKVTRFHMNDFVFR